MIFFFIFNLPRLPAQLLYTPAEKPLEIAVLSMFDFGQVSCCKD